MSVTSLRGGDEVAEEEDEKDKVLPLNRVGANAEGYRTVTYRYDNWSFRLRALPQRGFKNRY